MADGLAYAQMIKYVSGQPHDIRRGTIGEIQAKIAKTLIEQRRELTLPDHKEELMKAIEAIYSSDHTVTITLDQSAIALVRLAHTKDEDLPQC